MSDENSKEREVMMVMRKVLAQIIKDTTPPVRTMRHPLSPQTIEDVRDCLKLIAARERELADLAGIPEERPYFTDEQPGAEVVSIDSIGRPPKREDS